MLYNSQYSLPRNVKQPHILYLLPLLSVLQVRGSSGQAREALRRHFTELQAAASRLLTDRLTTLLAEVDAIEAESVKPLDDCQSLIEHGVSQADELLREGGSMKYICKTFLFFSGRSKGILVLYYLCYCVIIKQNLWVSDKSFVDGSWQFSLFSS